MEILEVQLLPADLEDAGSYAHLSRDHTQRKLEHQQSRYSDLERNIRVGRAARNGVARALRDAGIACDFESTPATRWKSYSIVTSDGHFIQPRFIGDYPRHKLLPEDVGSFETRPHDFYVATASSDGLRTLDILGYATRREMEERRPKSLGHGKDNRYVPLNRLHPFQELIAWLRSHAASQAALPGAVTPRHQTRAMGDGHSGRPPEPRAGDCL
jgi:hypothetical protein